jgi:homogentisate 1,2-dioxygenase
MHWIRGSVTRQAHVDVPTGTVEEEYGREGFSGRATHLYRSAPPVGWTKIDGELRPRALSVAELPGLAAGDFLASRVAFLRNDDVVLSFARVTEPTPYAFRNADGDEVLFVHAGEGTVETDFGPLAYGAGDYLVLPRGTAYRIGPRAPTQLLVIQTRGEVTVPERGLMGKHALFDIDVLDVPTPCPAAPEPGRTEWELRIQRGGELTRVFYPFDPLNTVGWKGETCAFRLSTRDIRPVSSERYHLPPSAHATFVADGVVLCTFLPRPLEHGDPGALRVPFYHSNIDYDEVLFYHRGDFFSRPGMSAGMVTFHPQGIHHGPQPGAAERADRAQRTDEVAVMIDTRRPLALTDAARSVEAADYWKSWQTKERT